LYALRRRSIAPVAAAHRASLGDGSGSSAWKIGFSGVGAGVDAVACRPSSGSAPIGGGRESPLTHPAPRLSTRFFTDARIISAAAGSGGTPRGRAVLPRRRIGANAQPSPSHRPPSACLGETTSI